jgi:alpha-beta hydrolase superfamily lysophospholipase
MQRLPALLATLLLAATSSSLSAADPENLEASICGALREPFVFSIWSGAAGRPDPEAVKRIANAVSISHTTKDGRLLRGYKLNSNGPVVGSVLVAQGNAMLADQLLGYLNALSQAGMEVYVFDYRGYGRSEGLRRLQAMVSDYAELLASIRKSSRGKLFLYGLSFGGIVLLNAAGGGAAFDGAVIDSTPSRVSNFGCPKDYDPVERLPADASRLLLIAGEQDRVVPPADSKELLDIAQARGARVEVYPEFAHPFERADAGNTAKRLELIRSFFAETPH